MMLKRIFPIASIVFCLLGTNGLAAPNSKITTHTSTKNVKLSNTLIIQAERNSAEKTMKTAPVELKNKETTYKDYVVPGSIVCLIIILLGSYWAFFRKKLISK